jgi:RND family efflux transporter MFP subunit
MTPSEPQNDFEDNSPRTVLQRPNRRRLWWSLLTLLTLTGGGIAAWRLLTPHSKPPQTQTAQELPTIPVKLSTVKSGIIEDSSEFVASLESRRSITLVPTIQGQVTRIFARTGETVKEGTPILQIDPRQQLTPITTINNEVLAAQTQLDNARSTLRSLEAERTTYQTELKLNQQEYDRYNTLASQGAASRQTKDQYANRLATSKTNLEATEAKIKAQQTTISQAEKAIQQAQANTKQQQQQQQLQLQKNRITAPIAGTIGDIPVKVGDLVNTSTQLVTISQNQPLEVHVYIPVERASQLRNGMPIELINSQGETLGTSRVIFITPNTSKSTQSLLIKALYNNTKNELRPEQFARARVIWNQRQGVLIPTTAVSRVGGETFVYVAETAPLLPGKSSQLVAKQKPVKLGNIKGNNYQVLEGLQPGEQVITSGLLNLRDGDAVRNRE